MIVLRIVSLAGACLLSATMALATGGPYSETGTPKAPFHVTKGHIVAPRVVELQDDGIRLAWWRERASDGVETAYYAIDPDGRGFRRVRRTSYELKLADDAFDPVRPQPLIHATLRSDERSNLYIVQFVTQPLEAFREELRRLGAKVHKFLANHAHIVEMSPAVTDRVASLPYVRWIGPFHPAYRLEDFLRVRLALHSLDPIPTQYNLMLTKRGRRLATLVADRIGAMGGVVDALVPESFVLRATLTPEQLIEVIFWDDVLYVDRWRAPESDSDIAREISGANFVEAVAGYTGEGVRGEVMDTGVMEEHSDLISRPLIFHGLRSEYAEHGTSTVGIQFGDGSGDMRALGILPSAQGIFADWNHLDNRHAHTAELTRGPYFAVYQSNSWGNGGTTDYTNQSAAFDDLLFLNDILACQSQSNNGDRRSRVQAWAKNVVSVGAVNHQDTLDRSDDRWDAGASIGPASDGRIKPDLIHFFDSVYTLAADGGYREFCCTSAATAITAGYFGLFFEMWHDGIFGTPTAGTVFHSRPHMTTAKAMIINTANQYAFTGMEHDLTRTHQGWGMADVGRLYELRDGFFIVDETDVLANLESKVYTLTVPIGEPAFRATLVYADPAGGPFSSQHRINDLTLRVTSPDQTVYYGNNGLLEGNWSQPGGEPNTIDTVENVFIEFPASGQWTVEVLADEINEDGHLETATLDADFALVVSGVKVRSTSYSFFDDDRDGDVDVRDYRSYRECVTGPIESAGFDGLPVGCERADCDRDGDVDLIDFDCFARSFTGDCGVRLQADLTDREGCEGDVIVLDAEAVGGAVAFQWLRDGIPIPDAKQGPLTFDPAMHEDEGVYQVIAWSECGIEQSRAARLTVPTPAFGFILPPSSRSVCRGEQVTIGAFVDGKPPLSLQWQRDGTDIPGAITTPYVIGSVDVGDFGSYRVVVHDACDLIHASNVMELLSSNVSFVEQPDDLDVCAGNPIELTAKVTASATFQWFKDGAAIPGEQQALLRIEKAEVDDAGAYRIHVENECNKLVSRPAAVVVTDCGDSP